MKAKKSFGQHFLTSQKAVSDIVAAADLSSKDTVLEIGPGKGVLTGVLLKKAGKVIAVEKDGELVNHLKEKFSGEIATGILELVHGDILSFNPSSYNLKPKTYKLVGNIPYYITGEILRFFLSSDTQPQSMVLLLQKEVVERIVARNGKESLLSLSVKVYGGPRLIVKVPRRYFSPKPKVDSAIVAIVGISKQFFQNIDEKLFFEVLHAGFAHKRKFVMRNLETLFSQASLENTFISCGVPEKARAENLTLNNWECLIRGLSSDN